MTKTYIYNAFIAPKEEVGGNPATVVLNADGLSDAEKKKIVAGAQTDDTVFVLKPTKDRADFRLQYFINGEEMLLSGHATVAAVTCMKECGSLESGRYTLELMNGRFIHLSSKAEKVFLEQEHPIYEEPSMDDIMAVLTAAGVPMPSVLPGYMPMVVCATNRSFVIGVKDLETLKSIKPDFDKLAEISEGLDIVGFLFFSPETVHEENDFCIRVFAPAVGVNEDSASGTLAGALGCYVYDLQESEQERFNIEQGYFMEPERPSFVTVYVETEGRKFLGPRVGGTAKKA
ncbi:MAG: PhzF family phenazine biosynthesis protein [Alphaproteobacteria bacterium]|jgi:PhzF family phenazine biosynthesis protein